MSFDLSFSPEFFMLPGELYDGAEYPHGDEPYSVLGAIRTTISEEGWRNIAVDVFGMGDDMAQYLTEEAILSKITETNTCTDLRSPVTVWIDPEGYYTVDVYERGDRPDL